MAQYFIGLMTGTSCDAVDVVLVDLAQQFPELIAALSLPLSAELRAAILALSTTTEVALDELYTLDSQLADCYAAAVQALLLETPGIQSTDIIAIGSHGQTVRHRPRYQPAFTVQLGDPSRLAALTGICTVADFRRKDMALGGQGAPFAPAFHQQFFSQPDQAIAVVNIGGMANISLLEARQQIVAFDTGPGNVLLDLYMQQKRQQPYDAEGHLAAAGTVDQHLLALLLQEPYLQLPPPKSTGRELFNWQWLQQQLAALALTDEDVLATLSDYTAKTIATALCYSTRPVEKIYVCGGGSKNKHLLNRLAVFAACEVMTSQALGIDPQWVEAMTFAWLAKQTFYQQKVDLTAITGAREACILGGIYY